MKQPRPTFQKGFSLVELLVSVSIFIIITGVILWNQNKFSSDISLTNVAYEVALEIRESQVYGTLVREQSLAIDNKFAKAYGTEFYESGNTIRFRQFADNNNNMVYNYDLPVNASDDTELGNYDLREGNVVTDICTYTNTTTQAGKLCFKEDGGSLSSVAISFLRPEPDARIVDSSGSTMKKRVEITVSSSLGDKKRMIIVLGTGQISVKSI